MKRRDNLSFQHKPMRLNSKLFLASLLFSVSLTSYGVTPSAQSFANLNGNWRITGKQERNQYPLLSATLTVVGNRIIGAGWYDVICTTKMSERFDGNINFIGQIDSDGSFSLSSDTSGNDFPVLIKGTAPKAGSKTWNGSYTFNIPPYKPMGANPYGNCRSPQAGSFVATAIPPLNGTYVGAIDSKELDPGVIASIQISQQDRNTQPIPFGINRCVYYLNSSISVRGTTLFTHGTPRKTSFPPPGFPEAKIYGDHFSLNFEMDGGLPLMIWGRISDSSADTLVDVHYRVGCSDKGKCFPASGTGTLTKQ
jgi:hypothetical protein